MMDEEQPSTEVLRFVGNDEESTYLVQENCTTVFSSPGSHNKGSSKLTLKNFVNFNWDECYYRGQLIALHISESFMAYGFTKPDTSEGLVRIVKIKTNERVLVKGFSSLVEDLSFAHLYGIIMLACIDESGSVYVYVVKEDYSSQTLAVYPIFKINGDPSYCYKNKHLISWCQYVPEQVKHLKKLEFDPTYKGKMLAIVRGSEVEIWHIGIASEFTSGPISANFELNKSIDNDTLQKINSALIKIDLKDSVIVNVSFSPDGTNISLALTNGSIYFYQISFESGIIESPKRVFSWHPEEIFLSLRSMVFLDNRKLNDGDIELWKYVITYSNNNELLLWSCETWQCLQKLSFVRRLNATNPMKLSIDDTGKYVFLSDIDNNLLYVMELSVDINSSKKNIKIVSVSEILLQSPMLNMIIVNSKISHNDMSFIDKSNYNTKSDGLSKYTTIINLFAIQPKSLQEGQLIISSPELSIMEQTIEINEVEPTNIFPKAPFLVDVMPSSVGLSTNDVKEPKMLNEKLYPVHELSSMEVHNLVKEKLRLKGVSLGQKIEITPNNGIQLATKKQNTHNNINQVVQPSSNNYIFAQNPFDLDQMRDCSPSNNEVQTIFQEHSEQELPFSYQNIEAQDDNFESLSNFSIEIDMKEPKLPWSGNDTVFNSSMSTIVQPLDKNKTEDSIIESKVDDIHAMVLEINNQLKCITKKQKKIDNQLASYTNPADLCRNLEPVLLGMIKDTNDQSHMKLQVSIDRQLGVFQKKIVDIIRNSNKVDTDLFTRTLVSSLSPTLDAILKDLFMSTVIPKFEHACCSMFKQIDSSFTERSLEYQNELKLLLNEEGNINSKLEYAFDKFKNDMSNIVKHSEKKILCAQNDMQKQFSFLIKEKSLSQVESYLKDSENIANQFIMLAEILDRGDYTTAFEKALSASNLDLVLYVCEKVSPEELFQQPNLLKTPVVLSLIQQLSHDLSNNTELKHKYLDTAVGSLDYANDLHKDNVQLILQRMEKSVEKFVQQYPYHAYVRKFKMLQFAVKTIIGYNLNHHANK